MSKPIGFFLRRWCAILPRRRTRGQRGAVETGRGRSRYAVPMSGICQRTFVSYIDRTREYYGAQGYEKPYVWARHAQAPFAPLSRPLAQACVALVTTASPWRDETPVDGVLRGSKQVWSGPTDAPPERLFTDDLAWDKEATH